MPKRGRAGGGSLADELAALMDTRPADPAAEDDELDENDDDDGQDLLAPEDRPKPMAGGRKMRAATLDLGALSSKYAGKVTSRASMEQQNQLRRTPKETVYDDDDDDEEEEDDEGDEIVDDEDIDSDDDDADAGGDFDDDDDDNDDDKARGDDGDLDDDEEDDDDDDDDDDSGGSLEGDLYAQYNEGQAEESSLLDQLKASQADEVGVARQAAHQRTAFLQLLHLRMGLQPVLANAAQWPAAKAPPADGGKLWGANTKLRAAAKGAGEEAAALLRDLCVVRDMTTRDAGEAARPSRSGHGGIGGGGVDLSAARLEALGVDAAAWWQVLDASQQGVWSWVETAVDEIERESGGAAADGARGAAGAKFKAVRQGPITQCEHLLAQLPSGSESRAHACHHTSARVLGAPAIPTGPSAPGGAEEGTRLAEVYEDGTFYHALIKELLADDSIGAGGASGAPKMKRVKRPTNNRLSKGRRLSYEVQPKLQNFMFPEIPERPVVLAELFASVFGQRVGGPAPLAKLRKEADAQEIANGHVGDAQPVELDVKVGSLFG